VSSDNFEGKIKFEDGETFNSKSVMAKLKSVTIYSQQQNNGNK